MKSRILYIEDDPINALIMEKLLARHYEVVHSEDGEKGIAAAIQEKFVIILLDINLGKGKMDGIETMKRLKQLPQHQSTPMIAVTSYALPEDEARFISAGFDDYIPKPVDREMLINRIGKFLGIGG